jgi:polyribonucleotide nucleotidyltransferase
MIHGNTRFIAGLDSSAQTTSELTIQNNLIGYIIGHQGAKINEIHQMSGVQIKTAYPVDGFMIGRLSSPDLLSVLA